MDNKGNDKDQNARNKERGEEADNGEENNNNNNKKSNGKENGNGKTGRENGEENNNNKEQQDNRREEKGGPNRSGRGGRTNERKQIPRVEWEIYNFAISFNPKTMKNKDPDAEFQAILHQIMKKSLGVIFHHTNDDMFPKLKSFSTMQGYPQTEAAYKDFFEVYKNKGLTIYKIYIRATMQYDKISLRHILLNYLRSNNLWMASELIAESVDEVIGFINYGHDKILWRPDCEKKKINGIKALIQEGNHCDP
jgi:hypothetical protein